MTRGDKCDALDRQPTQTIADVKEATVIDSNVILRALWPFGV